MQKFTTPILLTLATLSSISYSNHASAELTSNVGVVSQYHFRGIQQTAGASASAGLDYSKGSFSLGTWVADVEDGLEVDVYGSYQFEITKDFDLSVGATTYQYTGDFDSAYNEINLGANINAFSIGYNIGKWDGVVGNEAATESDYTVLTLGYSHLGFSGEVGIYGDDAEGEYFDFAYATEIGGFDVSIGVLISGSDLDDDESMYFSFAKSFEL